MGIHGDLLQAYPEGTCVKLSDPQGVEENFEGLIPAGTIGIVEGHHSGGDGFGVVFVTFIEPSGFISAGVVCDPEVLLPGDPAAFRLECAHAPGYTPEQLTYRRARMAAPDTTAATAPQEEQ